MGQRLRRVRRLLLGDRPRAILLFVLPTFVAVTLDVTLRARSLLVFPLKEWINYFGSSLASAGFWGGSLWMMSRLLPARRWPAKVLLGLYATVFVFPLATFSWRATPSGSASPSAGRSEPGWRRGARRWR